jgi:hypothetical protein
LNLKLFSKQYNKIDILHLNVVPQLSGGWQHNHSTKAEQAGCTIEQSMCSLMSIVSHHETACLTYLVHLGGMNTNRNDPI